MQYRKDNSLYRYAFDSLNELSRWISDTPRKWRQNASQGHYPDYAWDLKAGYQGALDMSRNGWIEGAQRAQEALRAFAPATTAPQDKVDFYGYRPHVPRYCAGAPDSMIRRAKAESGAGKVLTLYVPVNARGKVGAREMSNFGVAVAQYVNQLETEGTRVELHAAMVSRLNGNDRVAVTVRLKNADQPLDLSVVAFAIGHPAMFRRLGFAMRERCEARECYGYGMPVPMDLTDIINAPSGAFILNGMANADTYARTPQAALDYVSKQIETALEAQ